ncbi:hypothetical protein ABK040_000590 [Willaertia magna]
MSDFIFSQLEDLSSDTFAEFEPVSYGSTPPSPYHCYSIDHMSNDSVDVDTIGFEFNHHHPSYGSMSDNNDSMMSSIPPQQSPRNTFNNANNANNNNNTNGNNNNHSNNISGGNLLPSVDEMLMGYYASPNESEGYYYPQQQHYSSPSHNNNNNNLFEKKNIEQSQLNNNSLMNNVILFDNNNNQLKLKEMYLQDHNGYTIDSSSLSNISLICNYQFFGIIFEDSFHGISISQFYPTDIVTVVRQSDRVGVYLQFRRFLTCKKMLYHNNTNINKINNNNFTTIDYTMIWNDNRNQFYKDSSLNLCLYMMIEFFNDQQIQQLFYYININERLQECLKMIYPHFMYCAHFCTSNDVHLIYLAVQQQSNGNVHDLENAVMVQCSELQLEERNEIEEKVSPLFNSNIDEEKVIIQSKTGFIPKWAKKANTNSNIQASVGVLTSMKQYHFKNRNNGTHNNNNRRYLDLKKIELIVPPNFYKMSIELRKFCEDLLLSNRLMPYQLTVGLCNTLAIAETSPAKMRAQQVIKALSNHPNVQLKNTSALTRFIISGSSNNNNNGTNSNNGTTVNNNTIVNNDENSSNGSSSPSVVNSQPTTTTIAAAPRRKSSQFQSNALFDNLRLTNTKDNTYGKLSKATDKNSGTSSGSTSNKLVNTSSNSVVDNGCIIQ